MIRSSGVNFISTLLLVFCVSNNYGIFDEAAAWHMFAFSEMFAPEIKAAEAAGTALNVTNAELMERQFTVARKVVAQEKEDFKQEMLPIIRNAKRLISKAQKKRPIMAIAGTSAIGISNFTQRLASVLKDENINVVIFKMDYFLHEIMVERESVYTVDIDRLHNVMQQIVDGKDHIQIPQCMDKIWSYETQTKEDVSKCFHNADLILFEGSYVLCDANTYNLLQYSDCRIFIEPFDDSILDWIASWDMREYKKVILPSKRFADYVVTKKQSKPQSTTYHYQLIK